MPLEQNLPPSPAVPQVEPQPLPTAITDSAQRILWIVGIYRAVCGAVLLGLAMVVDLRGLNVAAAARKRRESAPPPPGEGKALMVKCVECGVYLPTAEARRGPRGPCCGDDACRERAKQAR
ncbi:MAG: hypothetical protein ABW054_10390, partial [Casimicrobiaceae bacterium]